MRAAHELLAGLAATYARAATYIDEGRVTERLGGTGPGSFDVTTRFSTAFVRPDRFRFDFSTTAIDGTWDRSVLWSSGARCSSFTSKSATTEELPTMFAGIAAALGPSSGAVGIAPRLLLPDPLSSLWSLAALEHAIVTGSETLDDDTAVWIVEGTTARGVRRVLALDQATFALRRLVEPAAAGSGGDGRTTLWSPRFDGAVATALFDVDPAALQADRPILVDEGPPH